MVVAWLLGMMVAHGQDLPIPAPITALALDAGTECPDVPEDHIPRLVTTTVGPATHRGDGSYAWVCPIPWGGELDPEMATDPSGGVLLAVSEGEVFRSDDSGCTFSLVPMLRSGLDAVTAMHWRDSFWVIAADEAAGQTEVMQLQEGGLVSFTTVSGLVAQDASPAVGVLWLAGLKPQPGAVRLNLVGGLSGADEVLTDLPSPERVTALTIPGAADDEVWIRVERGLDKGLWHGQYEQTGVTLWDDLPGSWRALYGPVLYDDLWLAALDGQLHTAGRRTGALQEVDARATWTDLRRVGDRLFAGSATELLAVTGFDAELAPIEAPVFAMPQLTRPVSACMEEGCEELLTAIAQEAEIDLDDPAVCPDGRTLGDLQPEECNCSGSGAGGGLALGLVAGILARRRRPRVVR